MAPKKTSLMWIKTDIFVRHFLIEVPHFYLFLLKSVKFIILGGLNNGLLYKIILNIKIVY